MELTKGNMDQWCKCESRGTCMGCMIQNLVRDHLGMDGERYLGLFIPGMMAGEKAIEGPRKALAFGGSSPAISVSGMSMDMK